MKAIRIYRRNFHVCCHSYIPAIESYFHILFFVTNYNENNYKINILNKMDLFFNIHCMQFNLVVEIESSDSIH